MLKVITKFRNLIIHGTLREYSFNEYDSSVDINKILAKYFPNGLLTTKTSETLGLLVSRSMAQYTGSSISVKAIHLLMRNIFSLFLIPFVIIKYYRPENRSNSRKKALDVLFVGSLGSHLHQNIVTGYEAERKEFVQFSSSRLGKNEIAFIRSLISANIRILLYPELLLRCILKVANCAFILEKYHPAEFCIISSEGSPWSSVLTGYFRTKSIRHLSVMHGIRFLSPALAFAEFDVFVTWGEYYRDLFRKMYVTAALFPVKGCPMHKKLYAENSVEIAASAAAHSILLVFDYPIMTIDKMEEDINRIIADNDGKMQIVFRPHPLYPKQSAEFYKKLTLEYGPIRYEDKCSINELIVKAKIVVSCISSALLDAWIIGKKCVVIPSSRIKLDTNNIYSLFPKYQKNSYLLDCLDPKYDGLRENEELKEYFSLNYKNLPAGECEVMYAGSSDC